MKRVQDEVSFTAAPHDRIKHLRLSPTLSANAEPALKKKKSSTAVGNLVGEGRISRFNVRSGTLSFYV